VTPTRIITLSAAVALTLGAATAQARYDERDAKRDCEDKLSQDSRYEGWRSVQVDRNGNHNFTITGKVRMQGETDPRFTCRIRHKEVVSWHIDSRHHGNDHDGNGSGAGAAAIGAGVLGLAILAATTSGDDNNNEPVDLSEADRGRYNTSRNNYQSGNGYAFEDKQYLRQECKRNIRHHLNSDHGRVKRLSLSHVHLSGRSLRGDGDVLFRDDYGRERSLSFTCDFDRNGRIYDGSYHYY